jgi:hypothetical protein
MYKFKDQSQVQMARAYNPSYSGGRDQENQGSKSARANSFQSRDFEKNPSQKRAGGVAQGIGPEFKPQYHKKKKNNRFLCHVAGKNHIHIAFHSL